MAKVGRPRNVETPEDMYNLFKEYKTYVKDNPRYKYTLNQRTGDMVAEPLEVPLSLEGFEVYIYQKKSLNIDNAYEQFLPICSYIKREIRTDQINGGMVGQYNASITQRLNGLTEKTETTVTMEMPLFPEEQKALDVQENYLDK
jgi:ribosome-associated toxin RatA of RatAB toxin-antitoxin module